MVKRNGNNSTKFRFASCNPRQANPLLKRREDVQEGRRRLFFQNVRQRREEERGDAGREDELHKLEFWRLSREQRQARDAEAERYLRGLDADLVAMEEEELRRYGGGGEDIDAMRVDAIARQEQAEMDALISGLEGGGGGSSHFSDEDDDYDGIFMELAQQQEGGQGWGLSRTWR
ncbi:hypothetical protein N0V88_002489 [Collariella sp. IMI 366227]|nr:hypothetical protein N0V88_002489 [Collariella sp. IMI 366227]